MWFLISAPTGSINHPIHLHGFAFNVMAMGYLNGLPHEGETIEQLMRNKTFIRSRAPVIKDTVSVPSRGYTVIRFFTDNPGEF